MLNRVKQYWPVIIIGLLMLALIDGTLSSLMTCHPIPRAPGQNAHGHQQQECTALAGPILTMLTAIVDFLDGHGEAVTAVFTIALAAFTGSLWWSTAGMQQATNESIRLARDEFSASHRPKLRLKHIWLASSDGQNVSRDMWSRSPLVVRLDIVNVGRTTAFVEFINFVSLIIPKGERLPARPPYNEPDATQNHLRESIVAGMTLTIPLSDGRILAPTEAHDIARNDARLYYVGTIGYRDAAKNLRQTAFCRYLDCSEGQPSTGDRARFKKDPDPDYEYKD